jgi:alpha-N-arabinofuranosidase
MQAAMITRQCCALDGPAPSTVGPDEFGKLLGETGSVGDVIVNFVTGTAQEAADFVAYMTAPLGGGPTTRPSEPGYWAALRAKNGHPAAYDVPYWEVGNEQNGPYQFGWRSGAPLSLGPHRARCSEWEVVTCLYAFGGTTAFFHQTVGVFADDERGTSYSTGTPNEKFYLYFPPVVPRTEIVYVAGQRWWAVDRLAIAGPRAHVYVLTPSSGEIAFGGGRHGAIPPRGAKITVSYHSGPHDGFVEFYAAMKKMSPHVHICETEQMDTAFLQLMGRTYPYDCVELHEYAQPLDTRAPLTQYEEELMYAPVREGAAVTALQKSVHFYSGKNIPVVLTVHYPLAEKYLLNSTPFLSDNPVDLSIEPVHPIGLSVDSAMIAGPGPRFVEEPTGEVLGLMSSLAGSERLDSWIWGGPTMSPSSDETVPMLQSIASSSRHVLDLLVINVSPDRSVATEVDLGHMSHESRVLVTVLDGPSPTAYNLDDKPDNVTTTAMVATVGYGNFRWMFPEHSVTLLQMSLLQLHSERFGHQAKRRLAMELPATGHGLLALSRSAVEEKLTSEG